MDPADRNAARRIFLNPVAREFYVEWESTAVSTVGLLRRDAGRYPDDPLSTALVGELAMKSEPFRVLWARHEVHNKTHGRKLINHPVVGELEFQYESFAPPGDTDQLVVAYTSVADSPTDEGLRLLGSWRATELPVIETETNRR